MHQVLLWCLGSLVVAHRLSFPVTCRILVPWLGIEPMSLALEGRFSTTEPRGKSPSILLSTSSSTHLTSHPFSIHLSFLSSILPFILPPTHLSTQPSFHPFHPFIHSKTGWAPTVSLAHYWGSVVSAAPTRKDLASWSLPQKRDDRREETFVRLLPKHLSSHAITSMKRWILFPGGTWGSACPSPRSFTSYPTCLRASVVCVSTPATLPFLGELLIRLTLQAPSSHSFLPSAAPCLTIHHPTNYFSRSRLYDVYIQQLLLWSESLGLWSRRLNSCLTHLSRCPKVLTG